MKRAEHFEPEVPLLEAAARSETRSLPRFLRALFSLLERHAVRYCVLHSYERLPFELPSDLDLAVHPEDVVKLSSVIAGLKGRGYLPVQCLNYAVKAHTFVFVWFEGPSLSHVAVDIIDEHRRKGLILMSGEDLVAGRRWRGQFWTSDPAVEFAYLLAKKTLKQRMPERQSGRLKRLVELLGAARAERLAAELFGEELKERVVKGCREGSLEKDLLKLEAQLRRTFLKREPLNPVRYWFAYVMRLVRRWKRPTGLFIAVLGPDGSGKSTLIRGFSEQLVGVAFRSRRFFHWRPGLLRLGKKQKATSAPHSQPPRSPAISILKTCLHWLDYWLGYWLLVRPVIARSGLVVFDRYFDDVLVDPKRYRYGGPRWVPQVLKKMIPTPDLMLVLDAPATVILGRKSEVEPEEVRWQRHRYKKLAIDSDHCFLIDAALPVSEVNRRATRAVTEHLGRRFETRHGSWLRLSRGESLKKALEYLAPRSSETDGKMSRNESGGRSLEDSGHSHHFAVLPSLKSVRWLLPLGDSRTTLESLRIYTPYTMRGKAMKALLSTSIRAGWKGWSRNRIGIHNGALLSLGALTAEITGEPRPVLALSLGTPGRYCKLTVQVMRPDGEVLGYVKLPLTEAAGERVRREASVLKKLWAAQELRPYVPRLLYAGEWRGGYLLFQTPLRGRPGPAEYSEIHDRFLRALSTADRVDRAGELVVKEVAEQWRKAAHQLEASWRELGDQALEEASRGLRGVTIPCGIAHGDFAPWNTRVLANELHVFDWEAAEWQLPVWWDTFHFEVQVAHLLHKSRVGNALAARMAEDRRSVFFLYLLASVSQSLGERPDRDDGIRYRQRLLMNELTN